MKFDNFSILINSTDSFEDCWEPFFKLFVKYWPDYKGKIYLNTETKIFSYPNLNIECLLVGKYFNKKKISWSESLIKALELIKTDYILFWLEDLFLKDCVRQDVISNFLEIMKKENITYIGLGGNSANFAPTKYKQLWKMNNNSPYKISLLPSLWEKKEMIKYIRKHETPWQMETYGSQRADFYNDNFWAANFDMYGENNIIPYPRRTGIVRGKWNKETIEVFKANNIEIDFSKRGLYEPENIKKDYSKYLKYDYYKTRLLSESEIIWLKLKCSNDK